MRCATRVLSVGMVLILLLPGFGDSGEIQLDSAAKPSCIDTNNTVICLHYFAQEKISLEKLLDGLCDDLTVRLVQLGSRLYAEVGDPLILPAGFCQNKKRVYMELPRVKRTAAFDLQIFTKKQDQSWGKVKSFPLLIYPKDLLQPLKNWARKNLLLVKGKSEKLIAFLEQENIPYALRNIYTNGDKVILHVGDLQEDNPDYRYANNSIIVFQEAVVDLPQIRAISTRHESRIFVEMKLLDSLADSPLAQKAFLKIFRMALDLHHNAGG